MEINSSTGTPASPLRSLRGRFARFSVVGGVGAVANILLLLFLVEMLAWHPLLSAFVTIEVSTAANYLFNRMWTWRDRKADRWSFVHYHYATMVGIAIQWTTIAIGVAAGIHYAVAAFLGIGIASGWNFLAHHKFTFANSTPEQREKRARITRYVLAATILLAGSAVLAHDWDTFVFERSVEDLVRRGATPYEVGIEQPDYIFFGVGTPVYPLWYAYPPLPLLMMTATYFPVAAHIAGDAWLGRILIKLPFIAATMGLAYYARRFLEAAPGPDAARLARRAENMLLFNPLFLIVATVWGQFESALLVFLVLSMISLRAQRWRTAGAWWGLAALVKIFPLYLGPLWLVYLVRRSGWGAATKFFLTGAGVAAAISLPFFINQPAGFLQQVFIMHAERPPTRFAPIAFLYELLRWMSANAVLGLPSDEILAEALSLMSFILTAFILGLLALGFSRAPLTERNLVLWTGLSLLGGLLATKVVSEQYMLLPLGILLIARHYPGLADPLLPTRRLDWLLRSITIGFTVAAILDNVHFLIFIPEDVANLLFTKSVPQVIMDLAWVFGLTATEFRIALAAIVGVALVFPLWFTLRALGPFLLHGFEAVAHRLAHPMRAPTPPRHHLRTTLFVVAILLLLPPVAMGAMAPARLFAPDNAGAVENADPLVFAHYRSDWFNPTARPEVPGGTWPGTPYTPLAGYYNSIAYKAARDIELLRLAKVDAIIIPFKPAYESSAFAVFNIAERVGMPYALEIDLHDLADQDGLVPITDSTARRARQLFDGPNFRFWDGGYNLRLDDTGPRVLFLAGLDELRPSFTDDERRYVASTLTPAQALELEAQNPRDLPLWQLAPQDASGLDADTPTAAVWRQAYQRTTDRWWQHALGFLEQDDPADRLALLVTQRPDYDFPDKVPVEVLGTYESPTARQTVEGAIVARHVPAVPDDLPGFQTAWGEISAQKPVAMIVAWNDFDRRLALEPTIEEGADLLAWLVEARGGGVLPKDELEVEPSLAASPQFANYL